MPMSSALKLSGALRSVATRTRLPACRRDWRLLGDVGVSASLRYTSRMETVVHNIRDLSDNKRTAAEQLVGHSLRENQQLVIQVVNVDLASKQPVSDTGQGALPDWCNVYDGLTDAEIAEIEKSIVRSHDSRSLS